MTALQPAAAAVEDAARGLRRAAEASRTAWDDDARAAFDRAHLDDLEAVALWAVRELRDIAAAAAALEASLAEYR